MSSLSSPDGWKCFHIAPWSEFLDYFGQVCFGFSSYEHVQHFWSKTWSVRCQEYSSASASSAGEKKKEIVEHTNVSMRPQFLISCGSFSSPKVPREFIYYFCFV